MSEPLSMEDLTVKFHSGRTGVCRGETTIWAGSQCVLAAGEYLIGWPVRRGRGTVAAPIARGLDSGG